MNYICQQLIRRNIITMNTNYSSYTVNHEIRVYIKYIENHAYIVS